MNYLFKIILAIVFSFYFGKTHSQSCYPGFDYRQTIKVVSDVSNDDYTDFQVAIDVPTASLVTAGKAKYNGDDFRFKDTLNTVLSYWFDPATYNQPLTRFWVNLRYLPAGESTTIYMYYGNPTAGPMSSGVATFDLFDTFNGASVDFLKWDDIGNVTNFDLVGGTAVLNTYFQGDSITALLVSKESFPDTLVVEMNTKSVSNGKAIIGLVDGSNNGYGTAFQNNQALLMSVSGATPTLTDLVLPIGTPAPPFNGISSFSWPEENVQNSVYPTLPAISFSSAVNGVAVFNASKHVIFGVEYGGVNGSLQAEWVRARQYSVVEPTHVAISPTTEEEYPNSVNLTSTGPYCEGETLSIGADVFAGASYSWKLGATPLPSKEGLSAFDITTVTVDSQGVYKVDILMPGCPAVTETLQVYVATGSNQGTITPILALCSGNNQDSLVLTGKNGSILRWEMSNSLIGPWTPLLDTTPSLPFQNLLDTTYYRAVVKSGSCPEKTHNPPYQVVVNSPTAGGFVLGTKSICSGDFGGALNLVFENGTILWWESSIDNFATAGVYVPGSDGFSNFSAPVLTETTQYRAKVVSGVCPTLSSATAEITVYENPVASFTYTSECLGFNTLFNDDASSSVDGVITSYSWNFGNGSGSIAHNPSYVYGASNIGGYAVSLTVETNLGCTNTEVGVVPVYPLPSIDFNPNPVCVGNPMSFFLAAGSIGGAEVASYDWDFDGAGTGDGTTSPTTFDYATPGTYNVELTVESNLGCIDSITKEVFVNTPVDISFICDSVCEGQPSNFVNTSVTTDPSVQYSWFFEPGITSPLTNPSYTYPDSGTYVVSLTATIGTGPSFCTGTVQETVVIYEVPQTDFTYTDECQVDSSVFNSTTVFSEGQSNLTFLWDFDDASIGSTQDIKHKYLLPNTYSVELTASTASGCSSSISKLVSIYYMPTATFTFVNVCLGNPMNFANGSNITSGSLTYEWDFADGSFPSAVNQPVHLYSVDNSYDVELIATSNNNCKDTVIQTITVHPLPVVGFIADPVCHLDTSMFDDTSSINTSNSPASLVSYSWDFGDGSSSTSADPSHKYLNDQTYNVILMVTSNEGCVSQLSQAVIVNPMPYPNFEVTDACVGAPVLFVNTTQSAATSTSYGWNFGDNNVSIATEPIHYYSAAGFYQVWLVATTGEQCVDSIPKYAEVFSLPLPNAGIDTSVSQGFPVGLEGYYPGAIGYNWTPTESLSNNTISNPDATPLETTTYYLEVTDIYGCQNVDSMVVNVIEDFKLFIYNVITPDGNGQNDTWKITNIETFEGADIYVYDRWGGEVLSVKGYQNDWEGVSGTDQLPDGTYYYVIKAIETDKVYKGSLTVLRNK